VTSSFSELEVDGETIVEVRTHPAGYLLFDFNGKLLEEASPDREMMEDVYRDVYIYDADTNLIKREEYDRDGRHKSKAVFHTDDEGNLVVEQYYRIPDGAFKLGSRSIEGKSTINFDVDGKVIESVGGLQFPKTTTEFSETQTEYGKIIEERRYNDTHDLTLRIVTRYDRHGNELEYSTYDHELDGEMYIKQEYEYEFDPAGNWTTQTVFRWVVGWGPFRLVPYTRTRRTIEYF
jgi:hypothetical protein